MDSKELVAEKKVKGLSYSGVRDMFLRDRLTLTEIANRAGCTFQRIGQVLHEMGIDPVPQGRVIRQERMNERKSRREAQADADKKRRKVQRERARKALNLEKYRFWIQQWADGLPITQIAARNGVSIQHASVIINRMRHRYGWFPKQLKTSV
jgi:hypothetical protein